MYFLMDHTGVLLAQQGLLQACQKRPSSLFAVHLVPRRLLTGILCKLQAALRVACQTSNASVAMLTVNGTLNMCAVCL